MLHVIKIDVSRGGLKSKEMQTDELKSQLNYKIKNLTGSKILMTFLPHLRSVDKCAFLLIQDGVTSPMRANHMDKFYS